MKKFTLLACIAMAGASVISSQSVKASSYMDPATLVYPSGTFLSMAPSSVSVAWDDQEISLVDPATDDFGDQYVTAILQLGDALQAIPVKAYILYSFGNPDDPDDSDIWQLDLALYEVDELWDFTGPVMSIMLPEGIVRNNAGDINPNQTIEFEIVPTYTDYTLSPESGSTLTSDNLNVTVGFGGNPIEYMQSYVTVMSYEPTYKETRLEMGKEVTINDRNEIVIDLKSLPSGYYEMVVPEGFVMVTVDGERRLSPDMWLEYTIENDGSGIQPAGNREQGLDVYSIQGIRVMNAADKDSLDRLPAGIYVVNGRKVIIR